MTTSRWREKMSACFYEKRHGQKTGKPTGIGA
ncbi:hypothetical protein BROSI_A3137 [Candidatus Brocadia sinica JPN1]|uniref:Uncharacterized protein n=1 Tax=Candidatus Brocadia sinica JPN1 TaxID=1197129 RepID=A0ABQ0K0Q3_9BACT|nr:hypothetical protein BROSI_A2349 [Candidatus Brocadia sinica JPN1]GAN34599.1 hypothetical protein BROSI_A3137 [Candidatus Brocadia sinica JPN1]